MRTSFRFYPEQSSEETCTCCGTLEKLILSKNSLIAYNESKFIGARYTFEIFHNREATVYDEKTSSLSLPHLVGGTDKKKPQGEGAAPEGVFKVRFTCLPSGDPPTVA